VFLMYVNRNQWFFGDEWDFLANRSTTIGDEGILRPHNEHWSTTPILIYGLLFRMVGLTTYTPYVAVLILAHLAVVHLMWRVMLRGGVVPWIATAFCAAFIPFGPGAENLLWAFQIGFLGSVALGLAAILFADHAPPSRRRVGLGWATSVFALTFSGISVPLICASAVAAWMRRGFKALLVAASVPAAVYLLWLSTAGSAGVPGVSPSPDSIRVFPEFVGRAGGAVLSLGTATPLVGVALLVLTGAAIASRAGRGIRFPHAAVAAALGEAILLVIVGVVRAPLGLEAADATRYVYIGAALLLPLMVIGLSDLVGRRPWGVVVVTALAVVWALNNGRLLLDKAAAEADREQVIREQLVAAGTLFEGRALLRTDPEPVYMPDLDLAELELLLPGFQQGITPGRGAVMRAALALQFSVSPSPQVRSSVPISHLRATDATMVLLPSGCANIRPLGPEARLLIPFEPPSSVGLSSRVPLAVEVFMSADGIEPDYRGSVQLEPAETVYLNVAIDEAIVGQGDIVVGIPWRIQACPAGPPMDG
jgi:hypothetical protein